MFKIISSLFSDTEKNTIIDCLKYFPTTDFSKIGVFRETNDGELNGGFVPDDLEVILPGVLIDMSEEDFRFCVIHELRHVEQFQEGRLKFTDRGLVWDDGEPYGRMLIAFLSGEMYCKLPWELDANTYAYSLIPDYVPTNPLLVPNVDAVLN